MAENCCPCTVTQTILSHAYELENKIFNDIKKANRHGVFEAVFQDAAFMSGIATAGSFIWGTDKQIIQLAALTTALSILAHTYFRGKFVTEKFEVKVLSAEVERLKKQAEQVHQAAQVH